MDHVRLFRNHPEMRWRYRVHEQILPAVRRLDGTVRWADVVIHHAGYQDGGLRKRKLERDLRLLRLEDADNPDDPFTLFNLGSVHLEMGEKTAALPLLRRSLERSHPSDSIVRKLYALIAQRPDAAILLHLWTVGANGLGGFTGLTWSRFRPVSVRASVTSTAVCRLKGARS